MCIACNHTIHRAQHNFGWNRDFAPALTAKPGETIHFECMDSSGGQLGADCDAGNARPISISARSIRSPARSMSKAPSRAMR